MTVVVDQAQLSKLVHEKAHARSCRTDHLRQCPLTDLRYDWLGPTFLAKIRQQQKGPRQALLARVEQLIHQVRLDPDGARQEINISEKAGSSWRTRMTAALSSRMISHSVIAVAVAMRRGCPVRHPSPQNSSGPKTATMASFPCSEMTVTLT
jgi:hypothetical protein